MLQPLTGRILLPVLGGSPAAWSTCLVFFQTVLLAGYLYAHALTTRVPRRSQWLLHAVVLIAASLMLPMTTDVGEPGGHDPRWWTLRTLTIAAGLPFFALAATAPLLQHWFSRTANRRSGDPYFLYASSNAGSLLGLLGYLVVEPVASRRVQVMAWAVGFWAASALVAACGYASARGAPAQLDVRVAARSTIPWRDRRLWIALALVPSALLVGVTQHLATDIVSVPLLWVAPLALYLATFMAAFSTTTFGSARWWGAVTPLAVLPVLVLFLAEVRYPIVPITLMHLAAFTAVAMLCHTRLAETRPDPAHLTGYFVCVSLGGVVGGAAAALLAPAAFSSILEYPLAIGAALLLRPPSLPADRTAASRAGRLARYVAAAALLAGSYWALATFDARVNSDSIASGAFAGWFLPLAGDPETATRVARASFALPAVLLLLSPRLALFFAAVTAGLLTAAGVVRTGGDVLARERTFFGVHQVTSVQNGDWHVLTHGTTTHGLQGMRGKLRALPTAYYHPSGPLGDVVFTLAPDGRFRDVGVVGLGAGALAAYAAAGVRLDFFEIDEAVIGFAESAHAFTYLADARARPGATVRTFTVDGRLGLRGMPAGSYDLIVIDAFSSDAIPTHLITREAVAIYESRLKERGLIAFHVSNRFFDLTPVLARIAEDRGLVAYVRRDTDVPPDKAAEGMRASVWVVLARDVDHLGQIARMGPRWVALTARPGDPLWTDDYTNVLGILQ